MTGKLKDSKKAIIVEYEDKQTKSKKLGFVRDFKGVDGKIFANVKPLVYKASFEGNVEQLVFPANIGKFIEMVRKFESSGYEVLLLLENKAYAFSQKKFNEMLESMLHKMVTSKYWQELHKEIKKSYIA